MVYEKNHDTFCCNIYRYIRMYLFFDYLSPLYPSRRSPLRPSTLRQSGAVPTSMGAGIPSSPQLRLPSPTGLGTSPMRLGSILSRPRMTPTLFRSRLQAQAIPSSLYTMGHFTGILLLFLISIRPIGHQWPVEPYCCSPPKWHRVRLPERGPRQHIPCLYDVSRVRPIHPPV